MSTDGVSARPLLRGRIHQVAAFLSIPTGLLLIRSARPGSARFAVALYVTSLVALLATSASYHRIEWSHAARRRMRKLDHSMIYFLIAGTNTAYAILILSGIWQWLLLVVVWCGAIVGITLKFVNIDGFSRIAGTLYIALGWIGIATLPQALQASRGGPLILVALGGLMYTFGAIVLFRRRPDPSPRVFGYHEIWHSLVVAACACHFTAITMLAA